MSDEVCLICGLSCKRGILFIENRQRRSNPISTEKRDRMKRWGKRLLKVLIACLGICVVLISCMLIFHLQVWSIKSTAELYIITRFKPYTEYVPCEEVLYRAVSRYGTYEEAAPYMNEEIYNNLTIKTKSYYKPESEIDDLAYVINQQEDADDPRIVYVEMITYSNKDTWERSVGTQRLILLKEGDSWRITKYIEVGKLTGYEGAHYFGTVYSIGLPRR